MLFRSDIIEILKDRPLTKDSPEMVDFKARCLINQKFIKDALNYSVKDSASPVKILGELLAQVGVKLKSTRHRSADGLIRLYSLDMDEWIFLHAIVENRVIARTSESLISDPHHSISSIEGSVDQQEKPQQSEEWEEDFEAETYEYVPTAEELAAWTVTTW